MWLGRGKVDTCTIPLFLLLIWLYRLIYPGGKPFGRKRQTFWVIGNWEDQQTCVRIKHWGKIPIFSLKRHRQAIGADTQRADVARGGQIRDVVVAEVRDVAQCIKRTRSAGPHM